MWMRSESLSVWAGTSRQLLGLMMVIGLSVGACGEEANAPRAPRQSPDGVTNARATRYERLQPLNLQPGEALPGIHLRPGIEVIQFDAQASRDVVVSADGSELSFFGAARAHLDTHDEIWSGDVFMGDGFIGTLVSMRIGPSGEPIATLREFQLLEVLHGEWDLTFDEMVDQGILTPHDDMRTQRRGLGADCTSNTDCKVDFGNLIGAEFSANLTVTGGITFPIGSWSQSKFEGKISLAGTGVNTNYACQTYTETYTHNPWYSPGGIFGGSEQREREVTPERFCIDHILVKTSVGVRADASVKLEAEAALTYGPSEKKEFPPLPVQLGTTPFRLEFAPYVEAGLQISAQGKVSTELTANTSIEVPLGFEYNPHDGTGFTLLPNARHPVMRNGEASITATEEYAAAIRAHGEMGITMALSSPLAPQLKLTGPKAGVRLVAQGTYTPVRNSNNGNTETYCLAADYYYAAFGEAKLTGQIKVSSLWTWEADLTGTIGGEFGRVDLLNPPFRSNEGPFCQAQTPETLEVTMSWTAETDLDMALRTPAGVTLDRINRNDNTGGVFLSDACIRSNCRGQEKREQIIWEQRSPPSGQYSVSVLNHNGAAVGDYRIEVKTNSGVIHTFNGTLPATRGARSNGHTFSIGTQR